jgi:hypothetical protein
VEGSQFRANLGINNLSPTIANVSVTLVDKRGIVMGSKTVQVNPRGLQQIDSVALFLADEHDPASAHPPETDEPDPHSDAPPCRVGPAAAGGTWI